MADLAADRSDGCYGDRSPGLSEEDVKTAVAMPAKGETMEKFVDRFGVARSTLYKHGLRKLPPPAPKSKRHRAKRRSH